MVRLFPERRVVEKVRDHYESQFPNEIKILKLGIRPWQSKFVKENADPLVAHPDIDILWTPTGMCKLMAVEVKIVHLAGSSPSQRYYCGLDEVLALLRFGVDSATLFHVFLLDVDPTTGDLDGPATLAKSFMPYQIAMAELIHSAKLPVGYRVAIDVRIGGVLTEKPIQVIQAGQSDQFLIQPPKNPLAKVGTSSPVVSRWLRARFFGDASGHR